MLLDSSLCSNRRNRSQSQFGDGILYLNSNSQMCTKYSRRLIIISLIVLMFQSLTASTNRRGNNSLSLCQSDITTSNISLSNVW